MTDMEGDGLASQNRPTSSDAYSSHEEGASQYLKDHKIVELFQNLTSALVYEKPEDPKTFMKNHIERLLKAKSDPDDADPPCFMDESNVKSIFLMLDITKRGYITKEQYLQAMGNLGVKKFNDNPAGAELNKITMETFLRETKSSLRDASATYADF